MHVLLWYCLSMWGLWSASRNVLVSMVDKAGAVFWSCLCVANLCVHSSELAWARTGQLEIVYETDPRSEPDIWDEAIRPPSRDRTTKVNPKTDEITPTNPTPNENQNRHRNQTSWTRPNIGPSTQAESEIKYQTEHPTEQPHKLKLRIQKPKRRPNPNA